MLDTSVCWIHLCVGDKCVPGLKFWGTSVSDSYQTFQLMSAVVKLKGLSKVCTSFLSNKVVQTLF